MEDFNFGKLKALKSLKSDLNDLQSTWDELSSPSFDDFSLLPKFYEVFIRYCQRRGKLDAAKKPYMRKRFLMVILYLYCPRALVGAKMIVGLRDSLQSLFGINSKSAISDNCCNLLFYYERYIDFRKDVNAIYQEFIQMPEGNDAAL